MLTIVAEVSSFSRIIDRVRPLRWFDRLGCDPGAQVAPDPTVSRGRVAAGPDEETAVTVAPDDLVARRRRGVRGSRGRRPRRSSDVTSTAHARRASAARTTSARVMRPWSNCFTDTSTKRRGHPQPGAPREAGLVGDDAPPSSGRAAQPARRAGVGAPVATRPHDPADADDPDRQRDDPADHERAATPGAAARRAGTGARRAGSRAGRHIADSASSITDLEPEPRAERSAGSLPPRPSGADATGPGRAARRPARPLRSRRRTDRAPRAWSRPATPLRAPSSDGPPGGSGTDWSHTRDQPHGAASRSGTAIATTAAVDELARAPAGEEAERDRHHHRARRGASPSRRSPRAARPRPVAPTRRGHGTRAPPPPPPTAKAIAGPSPLMPVVTASTEPDVVASTAATSAARRSATARTAR